MPTRRKMRTMMAAEAPMTSRRDERLNQVNKPKKPNFQLNQESQLEYGYYEIDHDNTNIVQRVLYNVAYDKDDLDEQVDEEIFELLEQYKPPELPIEKPISGKLMVVNYAQVIGGNGTSDERFDFDGRGSFWYRKNLPFWPSKFAIKPEYLFYEGDNPLFYCFEPVSHIDPESGEPVPVDPNNVIWKIDGQEVHRGYYLQFFRSSATDNARILTMEVDNGAGILIENVMYYIKDPDDVGDLIPSDSKERDSTFATLEGQWKYKEDGLTAFTPAEGRFDQPIEWEKDPKAFARQLLFRFEWNSLGVGKSTIKRIRNSTVKVKIDGEIVFQGSPLALNGRQSWWSRVGGYLVPGVGPIAAAVSFMKNSKVKGATPARDTNFSEDYKPLLNARGGRESAVVHTTDEKTEWVQLIKFAKKPGTFKLEASFNFSWKPWFSKRKRRTYKMSHTYTIDRDDMEPYIDLGTFKVGYSTKKV